MHHYDRLPRDSAEVERLETRHSDPRNLSRPLRLLRRLFLTRSGRYLRSLIRLAAVGFALLVFLIILTPILVPSYAYRPLHYTGTNPYNETVFIAANIVREDLIRGSWGQAVLELIDIIGEKNVFLSIYENDSGPGTKAALREFAQRVPCNSSIVSGHIDLRQFPSVQILPDRYHQRRIAYLAEVRNRALRPLDGGFQFNSTLIDEAPYVPFDPVTVRFDKLLFLNDVVFSAPDAADLLFATNAGPDGRTRYRAACAMDFANAFKFYDTFASRDAEGYRTGIPFFPWFAHKGRAISREAVLSQSDAVPMRACWGGMTAFEAKWFQANPTSSLAEISRAPKPLRFRAEEELFWESSECCLVHADLDFLSSQVAPTEAAADHSDRGIYVNPYIRVAYDYNSFSWLEFTRRFERLYAFPHYVANVFMGHPVKQDRRLEEPGDEVVHREWIPHLPSVETQFERLTVSENDLRFYGHWNNTRQTARPGGFCGYKFMLTLKDHWVEGKKNWRKIEPPPG